MTNTATDAELTPLLTYCVALDRPMRSGVPFGDRLPYPTAPPTDTTWQRVQEALRTWVRDGLLSEAQAVAVYLIDAEGQSASATAEWMGYPYADTVLCHHAAVRALQRQYERSQWLYRCAACDVTYAAWHHEQGCPLCGRLGRWQMAQTMELMGGLKYA